MSVLANRPLANWRTMLEESRLHAQVDYFKWTTSDSPSSGGDSKGESNTDDSVPALSRLRVVIRVFIEIGGNQLSHLEMAAVLEP
jgi:hypothetical protein